MVGTLASASGCIFDTDEDDDEDTEEAAAVVGDDDEVDVEVTDH